MKIHLLLLFIMTCVLQVSAQDGDCSEEAGTCTAYMVPAKPTATTHSLQSSRGPRMATRVWPVADAKALVLIVHGGGWHSGYFGELAMRLSEAGIFVAGYDQVGLGYSDPEPNAPEGYYHVSAVKDVVDDIYSAISWAKQEVGRDDLPLFLIAESAGAPIVLAAAMDKKERFTKIDGVVLLGGLIRIGKGMLPPMPIVKALIFLARFFPRVKVPATDTGATFDEAFGDRKWAAIARSDPAVKVSIPATLGALSVLLGTGEGILDVAGDLDTPLLAIHGRNDVRTELSGVEELVEKAPNAELLVMETDGHQLLQDVPEIKKAAMNKVSEWISGKL